MITRAKLDKALSTFGNQLRLMNRKLDQIIALLELLTKMLAEAEESPPPED